MGSVRSPQLPRVGRLATCRLILLMRSFSSLFNTPFFYLFIAMAIPSLISFIPPFLPLSFCQSFPLSFPPSTSLNFPLCSSFSPFQFSFLSSVFLSGHPSLSFHFVIIHVFLHHPSILHHASILPSSLSPCLSFSPFLLSFPYFPFPPFIHPCISLSHSSLSLQLFLSLSSIHLSSSSISSTRALSLAPPSLSPSVSCPTSPSFPNTPSRLRQRSNEGIAWLVQREFRL